jgi:hypothetical protein
LSIASTGFACIITDDDVLRCWGGNTHGGLGDGTTTDRTIENATYPFQNETTLEVA